MESCVKLCIDYIRQRILDLLSKTDVGEEEKYEILHELSELREELDELNHLLVML